MLKRTPLAAAIACACSMPAGAVYLDGDGLGQGLIYPYYTVRDGRGGTFNTYVSVVNHRGEAKALRVRFREARNGKPVLDLNVFLGPNDVWTAAIVPTGTGTRLTTADKSCTLPTLGTGLDFSTAAFAGALDDGAGTTVDRTREGYIEVLEMATLGGPSATGATGVGGLPANCGVLANIAAADIAAPKGGLSGTVTMINVADGADYSVNANALAGLASRPYYRPPTDPYPGLDAAEIDPVSMIASEELFPATYRSVWTRGIDAVSAVLMHSGVIAEWGLDFETQTATDIVLTFPTQPYLVTNNSAALPFTHAGGWNASCAGEGIAFTLFNRESLGVRSFDCGFPECPPAAGPALCATTAVISPVRGASDATLFGSQARSTTSNLSGVTQGFQNGWLGVFFTSTGAANVGLDSLAAASSRRVDADGAVTSAAHALRGLPVTGFVARSLRNGTLQCKGATCQGNYGSAFPIRSQEVIAEKAVP